jgi:hypothetical protein
MRAVLLTEDGEAREVEHETLDDLQALVGGGFIEGLGIPWPGAYAFGNDEAKLIGMDVNHRATALVYGDKDEARKREADAKAEWEDRGFAVIDASMDGGQYDEPCIAGPLVVVGSNEEGETLPIPAALATMLLNLEAWSA